MRKLVLLALSVVLMLTACSNYHVEITEPESGAQNAAESNEMLSNESNMSDETVPDPFVEHENLSFEQVYKIICMQVPDNMQPDWTVNEFGKNIWVFGGKDGNVPLTAAISDDGETYRTRIIKVSTDEICSFGLWSESGGWLVLGENRNSDGQEDLFVYMTADGGETWKITEELGRDSFAGAYFFSENEGVVAYNSKIDEKVPRVYRTEDGGASWKLCSVTLDKIELDGKYAAAGGLWFEDEKLMLSVSFSSAEFGIFSSADKGKTFIMETIHRGE